MSAAKFKHGWLFWSLTPYFLLLFLLLCETSIKWFPEIIDPPFLTFSFSHIKQIKTHHLVAILPNYMYFKMLQPVY